MNDGVALLDRHRQELVEFAIKPEVLVQAGVRSITTREELPEEAPDYWASKLPAKLYPWSMNGKVEWQLAPDDRSQGPKYLFRDSAEPPLNRYRDSGSEASPILLVEGTKQHLSAASYAPSEFAIYGMFGCWGWAKSSLSFARGRVVYVVLDGDFKSNRDVYDAALALKEALEVVGAGRVLFVKIPGDDGLDDFLAKVPEHERAEAMARLLERADESLGRPPAKKQKGEGSAWFSENGSLKAMDVAEAMFDAFPMALTRENRVALYRDGAYRMNPMKFMGVLVELLLNDYRPMYRNTVEEVVSGILAMKDRWLPDRLDQPLMNVRNGMVDLRTGELTEHDPDYLSYVQFPVEYDPDATCPTYEAWAAEIIGDQLNALEEAASAMLDPSQTPTKALLLFGPSRSGKSTYLRLLEGIAGKENVSGVTLHQLSDDQFAAAQVYGKVLNIAADLSARHVDDLSMFKLMTGEDLIRGNRKYGKDFHFHNQALFAFSANEIPTVGESSRAYAERIRPFKFGRSFAGREDHRIELRMHEELPGILARLVRARRQREDRGQELVISAEIRKEFELASDRVQQWVEEEMQVVSEHPPGVAVREGQILPVALSKSATDLADMFNRWAADNHLATLGRNRLVQRLTSRDDVVNVRQERTKARALNLIRARDGGSSVAEVAVSAPRNPMWQLSQRNELLETGEEGTIQTPLSHVRVTNGEKVPPPPKVPPREEELWTTDPNAEDPGATATNASKPSNPNPPSGPDGPVDNVTDHQPAVTPSSESDGATGPRSGESSQSTPPAAPSISASAATPTTRPHDVTDPPNAHAALREGGAGSQPEDREDTRASTSSTAEEVRPGGPVMNYFEEDPWKD